MTQIYLVFLIVFLSSLHGGLSRIPPRKSNEPGSVVDNDNRINGNLQRVVEAIDEKGRRKPSHGIKHSEKTRTGNSDETIQVKRKPANRKRMRSLVENEACASDIANLCPKEKQLDNFMIINCLEHDDLTAEKVSSECQNTVYEFKRNMTQSPIFAQASQHVCDKDFKKINECHSDSLTSQQRMACYFEFKHRIKDEQCRRLINTIGTILFSDFHLIFKFTEKCSADIKRLKCGRLMAQLPGSDKNEKADLPSSQGRTIECLLDKVNLLGTKCAHEIMRVAELQSDDFHLDRPLFFACRDDREKLCSDVTAGDGRVFKCLMKTAQDPHMSAGCKAHITKRMALRQKSYKVDYSFVGACEADVKKLNCIPSDELAEANSKGGIAATSSLSQVLLCLENAVKTQSYEVTPECISEMFEIRRQFMSDFMISPEIVMNCKDTIEKSCGNGLQRKGATLHCLMDLYKGKVGQPGLTDNPKCVAALRKLIKVADPGSDYRIDPVIGQACSAVIAGSCASTPKHPGAMLSCLMNHMDSTDMTEQCSEKLLELQYILSRDFSLDTRLYRGCHKDAQRICKASHEWKETHYSRNDKALVFSCLYRAMQARERYMEDEDDKEDDDVYEKNTEVVKKNDLLSKTCAAEVLRVVRERSKRIMMNPYVYDNCMSDLARYCLHSSEGHRELECLQKQYEKLTEDCKEVVVKFTTEQERHPSLDRIMAASCRPMIAQFCAHEMNMDPGQIMPCLIKNKNHGGMNQKCRAGIEHHQIISLKDYHISHAFRRGCNRDLTKFCNSVRSKTDAVNCLSEVIRNNTLLEKEVPLSKACRQQVRFENLQKSEDIRLSPRLARACSDDIHRYCASVRKSRVIQCLRKQEWSDLLTKRCKQAIFMRVQLESMDSRIDSRLQRVCESMIKHYCTGHEKDAIDCLWKHIHEYEFNGRCRRVVYLRLETRARDYRLDPLITHLCKHDIRKHCAALLDPRNNMTGSQYRGKVTACLKKQYRKFELSTGCKGHIRQLIVETNMNHHMDPILRRACEKDVQRVCATELEDSDGRDGDGAVTECLKNALSKAKLKSTECQKETLRLMEEGRADVHVDPVLYNACQNELSTICHNTPLGNGKQMACLLWAKDDREASKGMSYHCRKQVQLRADMWEMAAKLAPPETLPELALQVYTSNAKNYFFAFLASVVLTIFIFGICCGRATKRVRVDMKNK